jgi:hypothetical protein
MEYGRHDWCRQELEAVRFELIRLNHLQDYNPPLQFFTNELREITKLQEGLLRRDEPTQEERELIWWLASALRWTREHTAYGERIHCASAMTGAVCGVMNGCKSSYMGDGYPVD